MRTKRAFTLVELLVVITILALLIGILLPSLKKVRTQGKRTACAANLRQVGVGLQCYLSEHNSRLPYASFLPSVDPAPVEGDDPIYIADVLMPHLTKPSPDEDEDDDDDDDEEEPLDLDDASVFRCPNDRPDSDRPDPNTGLSFFQSERSSYEYRVSMRGVTFTGQTITEIANAMEKRIGRMIADNSIYIMRDYNNFHGESGKPGARRYLYVDGHVTDFEE